MAPIVVAMDEGAKDIQVGIGTVDAVAAVENSHRRTDAHCTLMIGGNCVLVHDHMGFVFTGRFKFSAAAMAACASYFEPEGLNSWVGNGEG